LFAAFVVLPLCNNNNNMLFGRIATKVRFEMEITHNTSKQTSAIDVHVVWANVNNKLYLKDTYGFCHYMQIRYVCRNILENSFNGKVELWWTPRGVNYILDSYHRLISRPDARCWQTPNGAQYQVIIILARDQIHYIYLFFHLWDLIARCVDATSIPLLKISTIP